MNAEEKAEQEALKKQVAEMTTQVANLVAALSSAPAAAVASSASGTTSRSAALYAADVDKKDIRIFDVPGASYLKARDFISRIERYGKRHPVIADQLTEMAIDKLSGTALEWYHGRFPSGVPTPIWSEFRTVFLNRFSEALETTSVMDKLIGEQSVRVVQAAPDSISFDQYLNEFESMITTFSSSATFPLPHEEWICAMFWWGLHPDLRDRLATDRLATKTRESLVSKAKSVAMQFSVSMNTDNDSVVEESPLSHETTTTTALQAGKVSDQTRRPYGRARDKKGKPITHDKNGNPLPYTKTRPNTWSQAYKAEVIHRDEVADIAWEKGEPGFFSGGYPFVFDEWGNYQTWQEGMELPMPRGK